MKKASEVYDSKSVTCGGMRDSRASERPVSGGVGLESAGMFVAKEEQSG